MDVGFSSSRLMTLEGSQSSCSDDCEIPMRSFVGQCIPKCRSDVAMEEQLTAHASQRSSFDQIQTLFRPAIEHQVLRTTYALT